MSTPTLAVTPMDRADIRVRVEAQLHEFLGAKAEAAAAADLPADVVEAIHTFLFAGGKRIRPLFCVLGWYAGGGGDLSEQVVRAAAAVELFHAAVLIHDDIIDDSDTRRDHPTVHRTVTQRRRAAGDHPAAARFGTHAAILIGDFGLVWSQELLYAASLSAPQIGAVTPVLDAMRTEVHYGQYLDLLTTGRPTPDLDRALEIIRYKTAAYTVQRPLQLGAALAGAGTEVAQALSDYGRPLGEAFQLQDDLLGVYGDPAATGKSNLDDLREGKHTVLLALALRHADAAQRAVLEELIGNPLLDEAGAARCRDILDVTGRPRVERMIQERWEAVRHTLAHAPFPAAATTALRGIAEDIITRTS